MLLLLFMKKDDSLRAQHGNTRNYNIYTMCTLLILRKDKEIIAVMNRDDEKIRSEEGIREFDGGVLSPVDIRSGGTWVGVNKDNVSGFLLNRYDKCEIKTKKSRGEIVLNVLAQGGFANCASFATKMDLSSYMPFILVLLSNDKIIKFDWNGQELLKNEFELKEYYVLTSSSIEEEVVKKWRYDRFDEWYKGDREFVKGLPKFNLLQVKGHEDFSVMVEREKVFTISITKVSFVERKVDIQYLPRAEIEKLIVND